MSESRTSSIAVRPAHPLAGWMGAADRLTGHGRDLLPPACPSCRHPLAGNAEAMQWHVCPSCGHHLRIGAARRIALLADPDSFEERDAWLVSGDPLRFVDVRPYAERLEHNRDATGLHDALVAGTARIEELPVVLGVLDFGFMGGSMGVVVGEKLARAADHARRKRLPLVTVVASGGARMQEGILALEQMAKTALAIKQLRLEGVPYISVLTDPTTGGVLASFATLGDIILAEPGALVGFAGPRVTDRSLDAAQEPGSHTAEFQLAAGQIDAIVDRRQLRAAIARILHLWDQARQTHPGHPQRSTLPWAASAVAIPPSGWARLQEARDPRRPTLSTYLAAFVSGRIELHGDRYAGDDPAIVAGLGRIDGVPVAYVGFERGSPDDPIDRHGGSAGPQGYRKAYRVMALAARWSMPVITFIDTPGALATVEAERHGLASAIAQQLALMVDLPTPIVAIIIGEAGSGGALALATGDRVLMQERAVFPILAPEGAARILFRDAARAPEVADALHITAHDLLSLGVIDGVIAEPEGGALADPAAAAALVHSALCEQLHELRRIDTRALVRQRAQRYRYAGTDSVAAVSPVRRVAGWLRSRVRPRRRRAAPPLLSLPAGDSTLS